MDTVPGRAERLPAGFRDEAHAISVQNGKQRIAPPRERGRPARTKTWRSLGISPSWITLWLCFGRADAEDGRFPATWRRRLFSDIGDSLGIMDTLFASGTGTAKVCRNPTLFTACSGVMNFQLKDARQGGAVEVRTGAYAAGDGESWSAAGNLGLPWGQFGFLNLSGEFTTSKPTDRSVQRADAAALISRGNTNVRDPAQIWGSPDIDDDVKLWANFGNVFGSTQFYGHANYAEKKVTGGFFFRNPNTRGGVFSADGGRTLLIGDLLDLELTYSTFEGPCRSSLMPRPRPLTIAALPNFSRTASSAFSTLLSVDPMPPKSSPWTTWPASTRS